MKFEVYFIDDVVSVIVIVVGVFSVLVFVSFLICDWEKFFGEKFNVTYI